MFAVRKTLIALALFLTTAPLQADVYLYMAEEEGCFWCQRWDKEIGKIYPKTAEGKAAPLRKFDLHDGAPDGVELKYGVSYTPTFILVENDKELARIEGYPGEDFFWGLLSETFGNAKIPLAN